MNINLYSGRAGSGKTTQELIPLAAQLYDQGHKVLIVQPSIALVSKTDGMLRKGGYYPRKIMSRDGDNVVGQVVKKISTILAAEDNEPKIVLTTHEAFLRCSPEISEGWTLLLDEELPAYSAMKICRKHTKVDLEKLFFLEAAHNFKYSRLITRPEVLAECDHFAEGTYIKSVLYRASLPHFACYVLNQGENSLTRDTVNVMSVLNASRFERFHAVHIFGAMVEKSLLVKILKEAGNNVQVVSAFERHPNPLTIYVPEGLPIMSRNVLDKHPKIEQKFRAHCSKFGKALWLSNVKKRADSEDVTNLTVNCHGSNEFLGDNVVNIDVLMNHDFISQDFMREMLNLDDSEILRMTHTSIYYQTVMRCCLRVSADSSATVNLLRADVLQQFGEYFSNITIKAIDCGAVEKGLPGRPKKDDALTKAERNRVAYLRRKNPEYKDMDSRAILALED